MDLIQNYGLSKFETNSSIIRNLICTPDLTIHSSIGKNEDHQKIGGHSWRKLMKNIPTYLLRKTLLQDSVWLLARVDD
ncbi:hypothetical protein FEM48_Zijuj05G0014200 [Ziziphus jujuba var. spinosa]|uniref:Uncharacterized protein n=1 Tax=Ziziphus jujuba var. spinosa TaxID=714518 RepID=A0A978VBZ9_ZIZJJ|nr:hypothetical protein FEM48_Zijuj05G0014200 [Ziziphus jujuba var. spinosa]